MRRAEKDDCHMSSLSDWETGQEHGVDTFARDSARDDVIMPSPEDWGVSNQRHTEYLRYFVPKDTTSATLPRRPISSGCDDDNDGNVPDLFDKDAWDDYDEVYSFDLSRVRLDEDEELL